MEQARALVVVSSLASGVDPETGEVFPYQEGMGLERQHARRCALA